MLYDKIDSRNIHRVMIFEFVVYCTADGANFLFQYKVLNCNKYNINALFDIKNGKIF